MKQLQLLCLLLFFCNSSFSQDWSMSFDKETNKYAFDLIKKGVDSICVYEAYRNVPTDSVSRYVLWKYKGEDNLVKIGEDKVRTLPKEQMKDFWDYASQNYQSIMIGGNPEEFVYMKKTDRYRLPTTDERNRTEFKFYLKGETAETWANDQDFLEYATVKGENVKNINFQENHDLPTKAVIDKLKVIVQ